MRENRIVDSPCWTKNDGARCGHVVDVGYGAHGFRVLVVNEAGELVDCPAENVVMVDPATKKPDDRPGPKPLGWRPGPDDARMG